MAMKTLLGAASAGAVLAALACGPAAAAGFYVQEQSVRGVGRAFSGEGADTGAASLWWNPASIGATKGSGDAYLGFHYVSVDATVADRGSTIQRIPAGLPALPVGGATPQVDPIDKGYIPNLGADWKLNDQWAVGLTVNAPFNFTTRYPLNSFTRYQALKSNLFNIDVQPTLAWRPVPELSLGVGFDANFVHATLSNALPNLSPLLPDASSNLTGKGWNYGWVVGAQWRASEMVTLGASYRSGIKHTLDGQVTVAGLLGPAAAANVNTPGQARFSTPSILTFSGRLKATDRLTLNAQVQHFNWSAFDAITVTFGPQTSISPQSYQNTTSVAVGADYVVNPQLALRAGVQRDPTPTPDIGRTARVPDSTRWLYAVGATFSPNERVSVDVSGSYIHFEGGAINSSATAFAGTPLNTPIAMQGDVSGHGLVLSAGLRFNF
jgi:long-chain fatty acid transport protein